MEIIKEKDYRRSMEEVVLPYLETVKTDGYFDGYGGVKLHYVRYECEKPLRTVVILHGFTESCEKFREMIYYFLKADCNVYIYDQRCHGKSERLVEDKTLTHVDRFDDYLKDFEIFTDKTVPHLLPLILFSHSMGGAVAALYVEKHPGVYRKAIFSSPMIAPSTGGIPKFAARAICGAAEIIGKGKKRVFVSSEYPGKEEFENSCDTSFERFSFYERFRRNDPDYQNYSPSYRWTHEAINVTRSIMKKGEPEKTDIPSLLFSAGLDNMVSIPEQKEFAERMKHCEFISYESAKHEIYFSADDVLEKYVNRIISFIND